MLHAGGSSLLEVRVAAKVYPGANGEPVEALRGVRLTLEQGTVTALLGPSGCGKTTLLRIIAGLDASFTGDLRWHEPPRIGFVFQEPNLLPWRTVRQNIELTSAADFTGAMVAELAERLGLAALMERYPGELSLGLARRVSIARALASRPSVLLLDEPFASLDAATAASLRALIAGLRSGSRITTLIVTHDLREAIALADRLVLLSPRPARLLADLAIPLPATERGPAQIEAVRTGLLAAHGPLFALAGQDMTARQG
jgi:NitT/TauT family transport system ATP-binding protein